LIRRFVIAIAVFPIGLGAVVFAVSPSLGQTVPDAGVLQQREQRQIEQERRDAVPGQVPAPAPGTLPREPAEGAVTVFVSGYRFEGNTLVSEEELRRAVAPYADRQVDLPLLQGAAAAVAEHYRQRGWIARTYLPQQDVTGGYILINVIEATVGEVLLEGVPPTRVKPEHVVGPVREQLHLDGPLSTKALDRGLLLADDLAGVQSSGALVSGERLGSTNVLVTAKDDPLFQGDLIVNNGGQRATGSIQGVAEARMESPFKRGDRLSLTGVFSEGSQYGRVGYTRPVGYDGWQVGVNASWLSYRLITPEFNALNVNGDAKSLGLGVLYPLMRARNYNLQWLMNYDFRQFNNQALNVTRSNYRINEGTVGLAGNWFEEIFGTSGATFGSLSVIVGEVGQGTHDVGENSGVGGAFSKIRWYVSRQQQLMSWLSIFGSFTGQKAFNTMDSAEKFYLGGPQGLRAYPVNEASGSTGWLATGELRGSLPWGGSLAGFFDAGGVSNPANSGQSYSLKGGGLTLSWRAPLGIVTDVTWAHRLGDNPNPTATGQDQDGSLTRNRFWFSVHYAF